MVGGLRRRWRALSFTPERFRRTAFVSLGGLFLVMVTGAIVRLTASGLGCDNWPRCGEKPFPETGFHSFVEFGNRIIALAAILVSVLTWIAARKTPGLPRHASRLAGAVALATIAQIPLGGVTVIFHLNPYLVLSHFLLAFVTLGVAVLVALEGQAHARGRGASRFPRPLAWLSLVLIPAALALVVTGTFVTAAGPHPGASGMDIPRLGNVVDAAHVHAVATAVFGISFAIAVAALLWLRREARPELKLALGVLALIGAEIGVGQWQWHTALPWGAVLLHVALASAVWCGLVTLVVRLAWAARLGSPALVGGAAVPAGRLP